MSTIQLKKDTITDLIDLGLMLQEAHTDECELKLHFKAGIIKINMKFEVQEAEHDA